VALSHHHLDDGEPAFWGHRFLQQLLGSAFRSELSFQDVDPPTGCDELSALDARESWKLSPVDPILLTPVVDAGAADAEIVGDLGDASSRCQQVQYLAAELGWVAPRHAAPPRSRA
jgi:hypothetical protein